MQNKNTFLRLLGVIRPQRFFVMLALLFAVVSSLSNVVATRLLGRSLDLMVGKGDVDFSALGRLLWMLAALYVLGALFQWLVSLISNRIAYQTALSLRKTTFEKLGKLPLAYLDVNAHGAILSRFVNDIDSVSDALSLSIASLFSGAVVVVTSLVFMLRLNVKITLVILLCTPLVFLAGYLISRFTQQTFGRQQSALGELSGFLSEKVGNQKLIKAFGYEEESAREFEEINQRLFKVSKDAHFASALFNPITRFVDHISYLLVGVAGGFIALTGAVSVGDVSSFLIYSSQFAKPFNEISGIMTNIQTAFASLSRIFAVWDEAEEVQDTPTTPALQATKGDVSFEDVAFSYTPGRSLLEDLTLDVPGGSLIAIVGPTGAGKTTIVNLLMRFYELNSGTIRVDGQDISSVTKDSLRRSFGMVLQDTWLFKGTIRENICYGKPNATEEELLAASRFAHAHSFIKRLPQQYDTMIEADGGNLSQGQKQLLTIARVVLTNPSMLILDEATSSIDTLTEQRVQRAFFKMMKGRTSFVIAHRLSTITSADAILVLDKGRIQEIGTHEELLKKGGFYYDLYNSQYK